jgi:hypothetical protein
MSLVKAGSAYYYNNSTGAVYPWSPDLDKVKGLTQFTPTKDGPFDISMTLANEPAPAAPPKAQPAKTPAQEAALAARAKATLDKQNADAAEALAAKEAADAEAAVKAAEIATVPIPGKPATVPAVKMAPTDFAGE